MCLEGGVCVCQECVVYASGVWSGCMEYGVSSSGV